MTRLVLLKTKPAKLEFATDALHMIAATVLLDRSLALGAVLGIFPAPFVISVIGMSVLFFPLLVLGACDIGVPSLFAVEAERKLALGFWTTHHRMIGRSDHGRATIGLWAPPAVGIKLQMFF